MTVTKQDMLAKYNALEADLKAMKQTIDKMEDTASVFKVPKYGEKCYFVSVGHGPAVVQEIRGDNGTRHYQSILSFNNKEQANNLLLRLSAERKLRIAGGRPRKESVYSNFYLYKDYLGKLGAMNVTSGYTNALYFDTKQQALDAYKTLTPDEQHALFNVV